MIPKGCKRLAEVDFPIAAVSAHAAREKSIRHGHPSTLHLWWARRPLASSRAVLLALLLPDPCDPECPEEFKKQAPAILSEVRQAPASDAELRRALLAFLGSFANWDLSSDPTHLRVARNLVKAAHPEEPPLVVDPFAGGGSIPLEALRLGCEAFASDLNPVACLILKVLLEDIPRHGPELAQELRRAGAEIKAQAEKELADLYPQDPDGATPIAYLWARTVRCEAPACGAEIPLMRSLWLCKKAKRKRALRLKVLRPDDGPPRIELEIFTPQTEKDVQRGTVARAKATCPCCGSVLPPARVRAQLAAQRGGADAIFDDAGRRTGGARMTAVVILRPGERGRHYRQPTDADYAAVRAAQARLAALLEEWERGGRQGLCPVPDEPLPPIGTLGFRVQRYGMLQWGDLFTARQKLGVFRHIGIHGARAKKHPSYDLIISKLVDTNSSICTWQNDPPRLRATFTRQALPMTWDFAEACPLGSGAGNYSLCALAVKEVVERHPPHTPGIIQQADAVDHPLPQESASVWFTDPPYYDAVPYADLSDFFLVWIKRILHSHLSRWDPYDPTNPLSPKGREAVQDETKRQDGRPKDRGWFEETMAKAFAEGRRVLRDDGIGSVVFAHKTTEGWEALLSGLIQGGWTITGSWPIATEMATRLRARESAALATSVHLVCRPRPEDAPVGDWSAVLRELPQRVSAWMERLQGEGVRGADLVFACIGPAIEIYSRYSRVVDAEDREIPLGGDPETTEPHRRGFLAYVWEVVGRSALEQVLRAGGPDATPGAMEEDARLTALFLWTLQSTEVRNDDNPKTAPRDDAEKVIAKAAAKGLSLPFDIVRRFAQPLGIALPAWEKRVIEIDKGVVRLLPLARRAAVLFGKEGARSFAERYDRAASEDRQHLLFPELEASRAPDRRRATPGLGDGEIELQSTATTLDRLHAAMLLQASGHASALRQLLRTEQERGPDFLRLANALSALYPRGSEEKRLIDAMLLAVPR
ncbi:MAG: DUF1156 domain-containing protein [Alphaproteobacteria bacterium]|nr:MAG: DUF1156 domain-containing protein [Alphaproteobacteria bacterium]